MFLPSAFSWSVSCSQSFFSRSFSSSSKYGLPVDFCMHSLANSNNGRCQQLEGWVWFPLWQEWVWLMGVWLPFWEAIFNEHFRSGTCWLSAVLNQEAGGFLNTNTIVISIGAISFISRLSSGGRVRYGRLDCISFNRAYIVIRIAPTPRTVLVSVQVLLVFTV